jgi:hypothetical protein
MEIIHSDAWTYDVVTFWTYEPGMRARRAAKCSFICFLRLRSTAMWVIRWLSTSLLSLGALDRFRFVVTRWCMSPPPASW